MDRMTLDEGMKRQSAEYRRLAEASTDPVAQAYYTLVPELAEVMARWVGTYVGVIEPAAMMQCVNSAASALVSQAAQAFAPPGADIVPEILVENFAEVLVQHLRDFQDIGAADIAIPVRR